MNHTKNSFLNVKEMIFVVVIPKLKMNENKEKMTNVIKPLSNWLACE